MVLRFRFVTEAALIMSNVLVVAEQSLRSIKVSASHSGLPAERLGEQAAGMQWEELAPGLACPREPVLINKNMGEKFARVAIAWGLVGHQ